MVNMPGRILSGAFSKTQLLPSKVIKTQSHLLILTLLFPPTPSEERQLCHSFYLSSEVDNFRVALL